MDSRRERDAADDLRATSEDLVADAKRLEEIEHLKARLDPSDPQLKGLADEGEELAAAMARKAQMENALRREAQSRRQN